MSNADGVPDAALAWADTVLYGGTVLTVDGSFATAEAVAIRDGRFLAVGDDGEVRALAGPDTREIDLRGRTAIPGLIDSHVHLSSVGSDLDRVTLFEARTLDDVLSAVGDAAGETPDGEWVIAASGWHESQLEEARLPRSDELDRVAPDNPAFVPRGGHVAAVNGAALDAAGIDAGTPDPEGGTIVRDPEDGELTGVLLEDARYELVEPLLPERGFEETVADIERAMGELNSRGVTGALVPGLFREDLRAFMSVEEPTVRTDLLVRANEPAHVREVAGHYARGFGNDRIKVGGVKTMLDGGVEGARLTEPYEIVEGVQGDPDYRGHLLLPEGGKEAYEELLREAAERGYQVQTHAVGDATIEYLVGAYADVAEEYDVGDLRWAVMHAFLPSEADLRTMAEHGMVATVQNHPSYLGLNMRRWWGEERAARAIPTRTILDHDVPTGGGTDAPVVPWYPFQSLHWMVTRETVTAGRLGPEEAISREEALRLWTVGSAHAMCWEEEIGSIEPGKRADLAVLDTDYLGCPADDIADIGVDLTMVGGEVVHGG